MKKFSSVFLAVVLLVSVLTCLPLSVSAETEGDFEYWINDGEAIIVGYNGSDENVVIPAELGGAPVTEISNYAFYQNGTMKTVTIPGSVKRIRSSTFYNCYLLESVTMEEGVEEVGEFAFEACFSLANVTIPGSLKTIQYGAFQRCDALANLTLPNGLESIGEFAFQSAGLSSLLIPESVTSIGGGLVAGCNWRGNFTLEVAEGNTSYHMDGNCLIETATSTVVQGFANSIIPNGVKKIGAQAFYDSNIKSLSIPASVESIAPEALAETSGLEKITVAEGNAFYHVDGNCLIETKTGVLRRGTSSSEIPEGVKEIGDYAFSGSQLRNIVIPDSVTRIGAWAFSGSDVTSATLGSSVKIIADWAFFSCHSLKSIELPDGLTSIGSQSFSYTALTSIFLPASVKTIKGNAFYGSDALKDIYCEAASAPAGWSNGSMGDGLWKNGCNAVVHWNTPAPSDVMLGDLNGNGQIDTTDYIFLKRAVLGTYTLTDAQKAAADVNGDGKINSVDYMQVKRHVLGTYKIG